MPSHREIENAAYPCFAQKVEVVHSKVVNGQLYLTLKEVEDGGVFLKPQAKMQINLKNIEEQNREMARKIIGTNGEILVGKSLILELKADLRNHIAIMGNE